MYNDNHNLGYLISHHNIISFFTALFLPPFNVYYGLLSMLKEKLQISSDVVYVIVSIIKNYLVRGSVHGRSHQIGIDFVGEGEEKMRKSDELDFG